MKLLFDQNLSHRLVGLLSAEFPGSQHVRDAGLAAASDPAVWAYAAAHGLEVSGHTAQSIHVPAACSIPNLRHLEYFRDHARVDRMLFDGVLDPEGGELVADRSRPGLGLELKRADAERFVA